MLSKIIRIGYNFFSSKNLARIFSGCLLLCMVLVLTYGFNDIVKPCYVYPEDDYKLLEVEAQRIINEKTLSSDYRYMIEYSTFNEESWIKISVSNNTENKWYGNNYAHVTIKVDDFGLETQNISVEREYGQVEHYFDYTVMLILLVVMLTVFLFISIMVIFTLFFSICCGIDALRKRNLNREV